MFDRHAAAIAACIVLALPAGAFAQVGPRNRPRSSSRPGLEATLWASEPMVINPTNIDVDSRGRVWVAEGLNYRLTHGATGGSSASRRPTRSRSSKTPTATARPTR